MSNPKPKLDLNIENYSLYELFEVLEIDATYDKDYVIELVDAYIEKFTEENNHLFTDFFTKVKERLEDYFTEEENEENKLLIEDDERQALYEENLLLIKNLDNDEKLDKMKSLTRQENPNLKKTTSRMLVIDSQFRQVLNDENPSISTDFTIDLSEPLHDLVTLRLFSVQIPYTWYTVDEALGTNIFLINGDKYSIESGNYTPDKLAETINSVIQKKIENITFHYNEINGKMYIESNDENEVTIEFFNFTDFTYSKINNNLGYLMGFHKMKYIIKNETIKSDGVVDLYGPKYLLIIVDDFNQNHVNSGLINVYDNPNVSLKLPPYFDTTLPVDESNNNLQFLPSAPRQLTQNQLYSLNQVQENKESFSNYRSNAPVTTDVFAFVPVKHSTIGLPFIEFGGSLQSNVRNYFGPVNVNRLRIRLMDDKGNIVNLNGTNWSFGIVCETVHHY